MTVTVHHGDALEVLPTLETDSFDAVVTDPPYGLAFMGREWDRLTADWHEAWAVECLRLVKPGGHLLAFGGSRTFHRLACAIEDAGFEIRDTISWLYGSGFPKSLDVSKAIDKAAGAERAVIGKYMHPGTGKPHGDFRTDGDRSSYSSFAMCEDARDVTAPATEEARRWQGWGTAIKPAWEPIVVARKPLAGTVAGNVQAHGTGALNIAGCRVEGTYDPAGRKAQDHRGGKYVSGPAKRVNDELQECHPHGRWPTNVVLDEDAAAELDRQSGLIVDRNGGRGGWRNDYVGGNTEADRDTPTYRGEGGASRFFPTFRYEPKATAAERPRVNGTAHPTVKPLDLMRWLVRLVTPPGGLILDPFAGSGTTGEAATLEGFRAVLIEREADYLPLIRARLSKPLQTVLPLEVTS